jgi:hypothetical protein
LKTIRRRIGTALRLLILLLIIALVFQRGTEDEQRINARLYAVTREHSFNYVNWEVEALLTKAGQELFGFHAYIPESEREDLLVEYFTLQTRLTILDQQMGAALALPNLELYAQLSQDYQDTQTQIEDQGALIEHIIEGQVSAVLVDEGFGTLGQVLPPVTMHFLGVPNVVVVSPRDAIRQEMTIMLGTLTPEELVELEQQAAQAVPDRAIWVTPVGGVGIWPSMVMKTSQPVIAFEITAHEWLHHYLVFFPLGLGYFSSADTRIINETTATVFGYELGNKVIQRFYADELAAGMVYLQTVPDYRALLAALQAPSQLGELDRRETPFEWSASTARENNRLEVDYLLSLGESDAAQVTLDLRNQQFALLGFTPPRDPTNARAAADTRSWIHHTRVTADYLLSLGRVEAAELAMENGRQHTGLRVLNQAWFAFNSGYQANPVIETHADGTSVITTTGGGGDPIGAQIYEIRARSDSLSEFVQIMRDITTREDLQAALEVLRERN